MCCVAVRTSRAPIRSSRRQGFAYCARMSGFRRGFASGTSTVQRLDGREAVEVFYATFKTKTAGMPFMATVIAPLSA